MKILALDTATELCSAALLIDAELRYREVATSRGAAEHILPMIDALLAEGGMSLGALDAIAFGRGPGGFTGVRLAASVTQGLAFAADVPVVPVSDLAAVARRAFDLDGLATTVLVCNDARMQEVYWGLFAQGPAQRVSALSHEQVGPASAVTVPGDMPGQLIGAGLGFGLYPQLCSQVLRRAATLLPRASEIARLAVQLEPVDAQHAVPVYVRDQVARPAS